MPVCCIVCVAFTPVLAGGSGTDLQQAERRSEADEVTCSTEPAGQPLPSPEVRAHPWTDPLYLEEGKDHAEEEMWSPGGLR